MIIYTDVENKKEAIKAQADHLRTAAGLIKRLKPVIKAFNGKVYNCRFDNAIGALSDAEHRFYCYNSYGWFYITYTHNNSYSTRITLLSAFSCKGEQKEFTTDHEAAVFDNKRILADKMITLLNTKCQLPIT